MSYDGPMGPDYHEYWSMDDEEEWFEIARVARSGQYLDGKVGYWWLFQWAVPWRTFDTSHVTNVYVSIREKLMKPLTTTTDQQMTLGWLKSVSWLSDTLVARLDPYQPDEGEEAFRKHAFCESSKRALYKRAAEAFPELVCNPTELKYAALVRHPTCVLSLKGDEVLPDRKVCARIINACGVTSVLGMGYFFHAEKRVNSVLNGITEFEYPGLEGPVFLLKAPGAVVDLLSEVVSKWLSDLRADKHLIMFCGDDLAQACSVSMDGGVRTFFLEGDLSACDNHMRDHALGVELELFEAAGLDDGTLAALWGMFGMDQVAATTHGKIRLTQRVKKPGDKRVRQHHTRMTGGPDTGGGNGVVGCVMALASQELFCQRVRSGVDIATVRDEVVLLYRTFGFELKLRVYEHDIFQPFVPMTFLKGYWIYADGGTVTLNDEITRCSTQVIWVPLPSRLAKLTKIQTNPFSVARTRRWIPSSMEEACSEILSMLRPVIKALPYDWFFGRIVEKLPIGRNRKVNREVFDVGYGREGGVLQGEAGSRAAFLEFLQFRYDIDEDMVCDFLDSLSMGGCGYNMHAFINRLVEVDY
jgi:hypothetical protein